MSSFSILILTVGIPSSGKSTWVKEYCKSHPLTHVISTDNIRKEITGIEQCVNPSQNDMIHDEARKRAKSILDDPEMYGGKYGLGPEIIIDSTNCDLNEWIKYKDLNSSVILAKVFEVEPEKAMEMQQGRERFVPMEILQMKWEQYQKNKKYLPLVFNMVL